MKELITFSAIWCTFNLRSEKGNPDHVSKALAMSLLSELVREAKCAEFGAGAPHFKASRPPLPDQARSWSTSRPKGLMPSGPVRRANQVASYVIRVRLPT